MENGKLKRMKYPDSDATDPAVLEKLVGTPFSTEMLKTLGIASPAERRAEAEHQLGLIAKSLPPSLGMQAIQIRNLRESPTNPRRHKGNIDDLVASVRKLGVLQPPLVRAAGGKPGFEIVFGHQRIRAAREAGLDDVVCDVRDLTDNDVLEAQAVENLQRSDLHEMEEAEHYGLMVRAGYAAETIADKIGKSKAHVLGRIKLLSLCPEGRSALYDGTLPASVGIPLARIYPSDIQAKALHALLRNPMTARQMIEHLQGDFCQHLKDAPFDLKDETLNEEAQAGACVACPYNANNMSPTLFGDFEKGLERRGLCLNTVCYGVKCREQFKRMASKAKEAGAKVLSAAETKTVINNGQMAYQAAYVKADDLVQSDSKKRTWEQIFSKLEPEEKPALTVAPDDLHPGKMIRLFDRKEAHKAARDMGLKWAQPAGGASKTPEDKAEAKAAREKSRAANAKQEAVLKVTQLTIPRLAKHWADKAGLPEMRVVAAEAFARRKVFSDEDQEIALSGFAIPGAKNGRVPTEAAVEKWIDKEASLKELIGLTLVLMRYEAWIDTADDFEPGFADLAAAAGANLKEGVRAEQLTASLEADKKGKK